MAWVTFALLALTMGVSQGAVKDDRGELIKRLLGNYELAAGPLVIPPVSGPDPFTVQLGAGLVRVDLSDDNVLTANLMLEMTWTDSRLSWDSSAYGGIDKLRIPSNLIWKPDIELFNEVERMELPENLLTVVSSAGEVIWIPPAKVKVDCFPDDEQKLSCPAKFGSWAYDGTTMDTQAYQGMTDMDLSYYKPRDRVTLVSAKGVRNVVKYPGIEDSYIDITYDMVVERSPAGGAASKTCE